MSDRTVAVLTSDIIRFEVQGVSWTKTRWRAEDGETQVSVEVFSDTSDHPVAEFKDVTAVWFDDKAKILPPEEE